LVVSRRLQLRSRAGWRKMLRKRTGGYVSCTVIIAKLLNVSYLIAGEE
jgi:hypothetical protein